jgi:hypothetical protein
MVSKFREDATGLFVKGDASCTQTLRGPVPSTRPPAPHLIEKAGARDLAVVQGKVVVAWKA